MTFKRHRGIELPVGQPTSQWEPLPHSAGLQLPVRIRIGADRQITREVVQAAVRRYIKRGGVIRQEPAIVDESTGQLRKCLKGKAS